MTQPLPGFQRNELLAREFFSALKQHHLANLQLLLCPGATLHVPGQNVYAGDYQGPEGFLEFWSKVSYSPTGRTEMMLNDLLANANHIAALGLTIIEHDGQRLECRVVFVLSLEEGRIAEGWIHNFDQLRIDACYT